MFGIEQFKKLQELKELGLSKLKVSEKLNLSYKTVCNWWDKDEKFFESFQKELFILDNYRKLYYWNIKNLFSNKQYGFVKQDKKDFPDFGIPTSTFFRYIKKVREQTEPRYEAQVDFVKHQFLDGRIYYGLDRLNQEFIDWLDHDGNGMINDTT